MELTPPKGLHGFQASVAVALAEAKAALKRKEEAEVPWCLGRFIQGDMEFR